MGFVGSDGGQTLAPGFCLVLDGIWEGIRLFIVPFQKIFQIVHKNIKISLGNWTKNGYNKVE